MLLGDFNYPEISWDFWSINATHNSFKILECIGTAHIFMSGWGRGGGWDFDSFPKILLTPSPTLTKCKYNDPSGNHE